MGIPSHATLTLLRGGPREWIHIGTDSKLACPHFRLPFLYARLFVYAGTRRHAVKGVSIPSFALFPNGACYRDIVQAARKK